MVKIVGIAHEFGSRTIAHEFVCTSSSWRPPDVGMWIRPGRASLSDERRGPRLGAPADTRMPPDAEPSGGCRALVRTTAGRGCP